MSAIRLHVFTLLGPDLGARVLLLYHQAVPQAGSPLPQFPPLKPVPKHLFWIVNACPQPSLLLLSVVIKQQQINWGGGGGRRVNTLKVKC